MSRSSRYRSTATIKRVVRSKDGYGGIAKSEVAVVSDYRFMYWHLNPWDREAVVTKYGLEKDTVLRLAVGPYNSDIQNADIMDVSASERWQILSTNEVWGNGNINPVSMGLLLAKAGDRP